MVQFGTDRHPTAGHIYGQQANENPTYPGWREELGMLVDRKLTRISVHANGTALWALAAIACFVCRIHMPIKMTISRMLVRIIDIHLAIAMHW